MAASYGVDGNEAPERRARDLLEIRLEPRLGRRGAGRAAIEAELQALPATIDGREETLALVAASGVWVATWRDTRARRELAVIGSGAPPPRLDLVATTL